MLPVLSELAAAGVPCRRHLPRGGGGGGARGRRDRRQRRLRRAGRPGDGRRRARRRLPVDPDALARAQRARCSDLAHYDDVVKDVRAELLARVEAAVDAGVDAAQLVIDPGSASPRPRAHNWALLAALDVLRRTRPAGAGGGVAQVLPRPLLAAPDGTPRPVDDREDATTAHHRALRAAGVWGVRVHEVRPSVDAALAIAAIGRCRG